MILLISIHKLHITWLVQKVTNQIFTIFYRQNNNIIFGLKYFCTRDIYHILLFLRKGISAKTSRYPIGSGCIYTLSYSVLDNPSVKPLKTQGAYSQSIPNSRKMLTTRLISAGKIAEKSLLRINGSVNSTAARSFSSSPFSMVLKDSSSQLSLAQRSLTAGARSFSAGHGFDYPER